MPARVPDGVQFTEQEEQLWRDMSRLFEDNGRAMFTKVVIEMFKQIADVDAHNASIQAALKLAQLSKPELKIDDKLSGSSS